MAKSMFPDIRIQVTVIDDDYDPDAPNFDSDPVASAGPDQYLVRDAGGGTVLTLDGSQSYALDGDDLSYQWEIVSAVPGSAPTLTSPTATSTFVTGNILAGAYTFKITVSDPSDHATSDEVVVWVVDVSTQPRLLDGCYVDTGCVIAFALSGVPPTATVQSLVVLHKVAASIGGKAAENMVLAFSSPGTAMPWRPDPVLDLRASFVIKLSVSVKIGTTQLLLQAASAGFKLAYSFAYQGLSWSDCSAACGSGVRRRALACTYVAGAETSLDDSSSAGTTATLGQCAAVLGYQGRPATSRVCFEKPCGSTGWRSGAWSTCSQSCGVGARTRLVECVDTSGSVVADSLCSQADKPAAQEECNLGQCSDLEWYYSTWTSCSQPCGNTGTQRRRALCRERATGLLVPYSRCVGASASPGAQDTTVRECNRRTCEPYYYLAGPWGTCTKACGPDGTRKGSLQCVSAVTGVETDFELCDEAGAFPVSQEEPCNRHPCQAAMYSVEVSTWSSCSAPVPGQPCGVRNRTLSCTTRHGESAPMSACESEAAKPSATLVLPATLEVCTSATEVESPCSDFCSSNDCYGHGKCVSDPQASGGGRCVCDAGFTGTHCHKGTGCVGVMLPDGTCCSTEIAANGQCCPVGFKAARSGACCPQELLDVCGECGGDAKFIDASGVCCPTALDASGACCYGGFVDACGVCNGANACAQSATIQLAPSPALSGVAEVDVFDATVGQYMQDVVSVLEKGLKTTQRLLDISNVRIRPGLRVLSQRPSGLRQRQRALAVDASTTGLEFDLLIRPDGDRPNEAVEALAVHDSWATSTHVEVSGVTVGAMAGICGNGRCEIGEQCPSAADQNNDQCCPQDCTLPQSSGCSDGTGRACSGGGACTTLVDGTGVCSCYADLGYTGQLCGQCLPGFAQLAATDGSISCVRIVTAAMQNFQPVDPSAGDPFFQEHKNILMGGAAVFGIVLVCACLCTIVKRSNKQSSKAAHKVSSGDDSSDEEDTANGGIMSMFSRRRLRHADTSDSSIVDVDTDPWMQQMDAIEEQEKKAEREKRREKRRRRAKKQLAQIDGGAVITSSDAGDESFPPSPQPNDSLLSRRRAPSLRDSNRSESFVSHGGVRVDVHDEDYDSEVPGAVGSSGGTGSASVLLARLRAGRDSRAGSEASIDRAEYVDSVGDSSSEDDRRGRTGSIRRQRSLRGMHRDRSGSHRTPDPLTKRGSHASLRNANNDAGDVSSSRKRSGFQASRGTSSRRLGRDLFAPSTSLFDTGGGPSSSSEDDDDDAATYADSGGEREYSLAARAPRNHEGLDSFQSLPGSMD